MSAEDQDREGCRSRCWAEPVTLRGERVELRPLRLEDASALWQAGSDAEIWRYMPVRMRDRGDMESAIRLALEEQRRGAQLPFLIRDLAADKPVGSTRLMDIDELNRAVEVGWTWLAQPAWRTAVNTECKLLLLTYSFESLGAVRVQLKTDLRNARSQRAIERLGAVREGVLRKHRLLPDGTYRDTVYYSIIEEEWPAAKERLTRLSRQAKGIRDQ